jgi:hypothetical protein
MMEQEPLAPEEEAKEDSGRDNKLSRINALVFGLVFLAVVMAPYPWNTYAPLLFLLPLVYSVLNKLKQRAGAEEDVKDPRLPQSQESYARPEPYTFKPRDPKDPRRYKPIE